MSLHLGSAATPLRHEVVAHQLDDLNALGDALITATGNGDPERLATVLATMERFLVAFGWSPEAALPALLEYVAAHAELPDDLFAPAFVLGAIAPDLDETAALLARLPASVRELLALATRASAPGL